jgi:hypothetical protein
MTEEDLIDLGFEQVTISNTESDNGYDYYFYQKELCENVVLHSTDSDNVENNNWQLMCWEIPAIRIETKEHYMHFLEVLNSIIC